MPAKKSTHRKYPKGGLTAEGRKFYKRTQGSDLKPGVKKIKTDEDLKRKGSFLRRHYGKKTISPLKDAKGEPTRYAKQAHAWGEPVPKTVTDVERLAAKGTKLLKQFHKKQQVNKKRSSAAKKSQRSKA